MKKLMTAALVLVALVGCGGGEEPAAEPTRSINTRLSESTPEPAPSTPQAWSLEQTCEFLYDPVNSPLVELDYVAGAVAGGLTDPVSEAKIRETTAALEEAAARGAEDVRPTLVALNVAWEQHLAGDILPANERLEMTRYLDTACGPGYVERAG